jgi:PAS domain S-box-containing protein
MGHAHKKKRQKGESGSVNDIAPTAEVLLLKMRLAAMFQRVPELMAAATVEDKLRQAAEVLTSSHFFRSCALFVFDTETGLTTAVAGADTMIPEVAAQRYRQALDLIGNGSAHIHLPPREVEDLPRLLVPVRDHDGMLLGVAELTYDDNTLCTDELMTLVGVFLMETAQSVEQILLERELERKEATYRSLLDDVSDVIFRVDARGRLTFVSRHVEDLLGVPWKGALGRLLLDFVHPRHVKRVRRATVDVMAGRSVSLDVLVVRPDGREIMVFVSVNPTWDNGVITGGLAVARDVTEKRRFEDQIRESERRYRALTENAYDAIFLVDPETCGIVDVNPQAEKLTGFPRADLLHMSLYDLRRRDQQDDVRQRVEDVMRAGMGRYDDTTILCRDGRTLSVDVAASVYELEGKRYYQAIVRDNTTKKQMDVALHRRIMELQILSEISDALQSAVDLQSVMGIVLTGVTAGTGLGFNRAFVFSYDPQHEELHCEAELGPHSAEEAGRIWSELDSKGLSLSQILTEKIRSFNRDSEPSSEFVRQAVISLADEQNVFARAIRDREAVRVNCAVDDPRVPADFLRLYQVHEFAVVPLMTHKEVIGVLLVDNLINRREIQDDDLHRLKLFANSAASAIERSRLLVNLERRLHELMLANQDLKTSRDRLVRTERLSAIGEVAANVAHEIRNPLTAIGGFARSVVTSLDEADQNRRKLNIIVEETDRLERMLTALLEFTRPALPLLAEVNPNDLVRETVQLMGTEIDTNRIRVAYELCDDAPPVMADSQQIRQVLINIIRNAVQEMSTSGVLSLTTTADNGEVHIAVSDTGPGIAPEIQDKIFDAFFTTKPTGSGLGLAICAQILRNHDGRLEAVSRPAEGATFVITLPSMQKTLDSH